MVAVAVAAAAAAAADAVVVVGDVECCGGGVEARDRCAERDRRDEVEEDDDVEDVDDAGDAAVEDKYRDETGLLERAFLREAAALGLSSAGASGGREGWAGSGAVAAVAAATMPSRFRGGAEIWLRAVGPRQCRSPGLQVRRLRCRSFSGIRPRSCGGGGGRPPDRRRALPASTGGSSELVKQCYSLRG